MGLEKDEKVSDQRFHALFNNISDAVFILGGEVEKTPGSIIEVNLAAIKLTGYTREELTKKHIFDISPKELQSTNLNIENEVSNKGTCYFDAFIIAKDQRKIPVEVNSTQIKLEDEVVHISVVRDINYRIIEQETLKEDEERSRKIVESSPTGAIIYEDEIITYINGTGLKVLGMSSKDDIIGKPISSIIHSDYWEISATRRHSLKYGVTPETIEMDFIREDGSIICAEVTTMPYKSRGKMGGLTYIKDITEQKRMLEEKQRLLEHALEYDRIKTEFFSNISHEIRTPLNIILSSIQLLNSVYSNKDMEPEKFFSTYEAYIGTMKQNSYRLLKLLNNLIDITRIDSGYVKIHLKNKNIVETVEELALSIIPFIEEKGISLIFDTDIEEKVMAFDEGKIDRILLNLLSNAVKYTSPGDTISVIIKDKGDWIDIIVQDTGCGIPEDKLHVIFDRFRQVDSLFTRRAEGSGMGLSLVKSIVEIHGGRIHVQSVVGEGSKFIISIPSTIVDESEQSFIPKHEIKDNESKKELINIEFSDIYN